MEPQGKQKVDDTHYDIFISYAHLDNDVPRGDGWITLFQKALKIRAAQLLGEEVKIWRDDALQINEDFGAEIKEVLAKSDVFVSVLTPRYIKSSWCRDELYTFLDRHKDGGSSNVLGNKTRIFKVIKTPVDQHEEFPPFRKVLGIEFYKKDTIPPQEFIPAYELREAVDEGRQAVDRLAYAIKKMLKEIRGGQEQENQKSKGSIYLAGTTSDLDERRKKLLSELEDRGYTVLPQLDFPNTVSEFKKQMQQDMKDSFCSIHMVGNKYGLIPEDAEHSVVEIQVDEAFAHSRTHPVFSQFIWLSDDKEFSDDRQRAFRRKISYLEFEEGKGDIVQSSFENFKTVIQEKLDVFHASQNKPAISDRSEMPSIYLIHTKEERKDIKSILFYLREKGFEVLRPVSDGSEENIARTNREQLKKANGILIFWGKGREAWFVKHCNDVRDELHCKTNERLKSIGIIMSAPMNDDKEFFLEVENEKTCNAKIISSFDGFTPDSLDDFLLPLIQLKGNGRHE